MRRERGLLRLGAGVRRQLGLFERAHDEDLVPVEFDARRVGEPVVREPACEPADQVLLEIVGFSHDSEITSLRTYVKS